MNNWSRSLRKDFLKFLRRSGADRARLIKAFLWLGVMRWALWRWPFQRLALRLGLRQVEPADLSRTDQAAEASQIGWALRAMASRTPWKNSCLVQSLAGMMMLRRRDIPAALYLGVAKDETVADDLAAHAWLCSGSLVLTGEDGRDRYRVISIFSNRPRSLH